MRAALVLCLAALTACGGGDAKKKTTPKPAGEEGGEGATATAAAPASRAATRWARSAARPAAPTGPSSASPTARRTSASRSTSRPAATTSSTRRRRRRPRRWRTPRSRSRPRRPRSRCAPARTARRSRRRAPRADNQLVAVANATHAVVMIGDTEAGKGVAEVWDVAKAKKTSTIKYARPTSSAACPSCSARRSTSARRCARDRPRAAALYNTKGKRIADVGGKDFGTYSEVAVQVDGQRVGVPRGERLDGRAAGRRDRQGREDDPARGAVDAGSRPRAATRRPTRSPRPRWATPASPRSSAAATTSSS